MSKELSGFNLDLTQYSFHQILNFFGYVPTDVVEYEDLTIRGMSLREQLIRSGQIPSQILPALETFITESMRWIQAVKCPSLNPPPPPPSSLPCSFPTPMKHVLPSTTPPSSDQDPAMSSAPYVVPTHITAGTRNPLQHPTIKRFVTIDSRHRDNYYQTTASDFVMELPEKLSRVIDMQLTSFEIPLSFYNICEASENNHFQLSYSSTYVGTDTSVSPIVTTNTITLLIPDGNYNALDLIQTLNTLLDPRDADGGRMFPYTASSYIQFQVHITESGGGSGKVQVGVDPNDLFVFSEINLYFGNTKTGEEDRLELPKKLGWMLGFQQKDYLHHTSYISESIIDPGSMRYMYLVVDEYQRAACSYFVSRTLPTEVLARITIKGTYFSLLMSDNLNYITEPRRYFGPVDIRKVRIRMVDEWGRKIAFNSANFSICLTFTLLYDMAM
jgi:hypothetical protein